MAFPSDVPAASAIANKDAKGDVDTKVSLVQTVETVPGGQGTLLTVTDLADGSQVAIVEIRKRFTRPVSGTGAWAEAAL